MCKKIPFTTKCIYNKKIDPYQETKTRPYQILKERCVMNVECGNNFIFTFFWTPRIGPCQIWSNRRYTQVGCFWRISRQDGGVGDGTMGSMMGGWVSVDWGNGRGMELIRFKNIGMYLPVGARLKLEVGASSCISILLVGRMDKVKHCVMPLVGLPASCHAMVIGPWAQWIFKGLVVWLCDNVESLFP